jgi:tRNA (cmo5U34)-methyltransferase
MQKDNVIPKEKWEFDLDVTEAFNDMLSRSIPQYEVMRKACADVASNFIVPKDTWILDLGSSRGESVSALVDKYGAYCQYVLAEISEPMICVLKERYAGYIKSGCMRLWTKDLRNDFPKTPAKVIQSILTIQFIPINYRQKIIQNCYDSLDSGGAFIMVEKVLGSSAPVDTMLVDIYHSMKNENGYSADAIDRKKMSLEGVLVPVTAEWNIELLRQAGFRHIECFWRWMNFAAWIAIK